MAKTRKVETRDPSSDYPGKNNKKEGYDRNGNYIIIDPSNGSDVEAISDLRQDDPDQFSEIRVLQVRGTKSYGKFETTFVVGKKLIGEDLLPFSSREEAQKVAGDINKLSEKIRSRK